MESTMKNETPLQPSTSYSYDNKFMPSVCSTNKEMQAPTHSQKSEGDENTTPTRPHCRVSRGYYSLANANIFYRSFLTNLWLPFTWSPKRILKQFFIELLLWNSNRNPLLKKNDSEANILIICNREDKVLKFDTLFPAAKVSEKDHAAHADRLTGSLTRLKSLITARFLEQSVHWLVPRNPFFQRDI